MISAFLPLESFRSLCSRVQTRQAQLLFCLVATLHLANAAIASWFGYLSPDSWNYLSLARNFFHFGYPTLGPGYFAVFPLGYPLLVAAFSPGLALAQTLIISKFINAALWISIYLLLRRLRITPLLAAALVILPFALMISAMTWSESLMIFALVASIAGIDALHRSPGTKARILIAAALIIGISSRYAFSFAMVGMMPIYLFTFRHALQRRVLYALIAGSLLFVLYLAINLLLTGYATGMPRVPTSDTRSYLAFAFADATWRSITATILPFLLIALLLVKSWRAKPLAHMTALIGLAYIGIITLLRLRSQFDPFDMRLLGPGWFLITCALALYAEENWRDARAAIAGLAVLGLSAWAIYNVHSSAFLDLVAEHQLNLSATRSIETYRFRASPDIETVIGLGAPPPRPSIAANDQLYYGERDIFAPQRAPYGRREGLQDFLRRLHEANIDPETCVIDFSTFSSMEDLSDQLDETYQTGLTHFERRFDDGVAQRFYDIFQPNTLVPCGPFLKETGLE